MVNPNRVIWSQKARKQLLEIFLYIKKDSPLNAKKVRNEILASTGKLVKMPQLYRPDKYKNGNDGSYRAFEIYHYRIAYHVGEHEITIVRIRHTSREPLSY